MAAITIPQWQCVLLNNVNHAEELQAEKMYGFMAREEKREAKGRRNTLTQTDSHTYSQEVFCSSQWSIYFRADEPQLNPNGMRHGNHLYLMKYSLFKLFKSSGGKIGAFREEKCNKVNNHPILFLNIIFISPVFFFLWPQGGNKFFLIKTSR